MLLSFFFSRIREQLHVRDHLIEASERTGVSRHLVNGAQAFGGHRKYRVHCVIGQRSGSDAALEKRLQQLSVDDKNVALCGFRHPQSLTKIGASSFTCTCAGAVAQATVLI